MNNWREPITDRRAADVEALDSGSLAYQRGALNADDLNRIEGNYRYLLEHLETDAIFIPHSYRNREETTIETIQTEEDGLDDTTKLLLHGESLEDSSNYGVTLTNNGVSVSEAQSKFGGKSLYFDGASNIQMPCSTFDFGSGDFTIDWWEYAESGAGTRFCTQFGKAQTGMSIGNNGTQVNINSNYAVTGWDVVGAWGILDVTVGQWVHWALVRNGNTITVYKNGVGVGTKSISATLVIDLVRNAAIGTNPGDNNKFKGYIEEFRVSNVARWTADFTPPEEQYGKIAIHTETKPIKKTYTDWQEHNLPWLSEINRIRANYNALVRLFLVGLGLPVLAESNYLDWQEVNDWERIADVGKQMFENMEQEYRYCGVEESGGDRLL